MNNSRILTSHKRGLFGVMAGVLAMALAVVTVYGAGGALPGAGTEADPYRIEDRADFDAFCGNSNYWDDCTRLDTDLDLSGTVYDRAPIAPDMTSGVISPFLGTPFTGVFDGNGHCVAGLTVYTEDVSRRYLGLFGLIYTNASVSNLVLDDIAVTGGGSCRSIGGLCGALLAGTVQDISVSGRVRAYDNSRWVGGLCGQNLGGMIVRCAVGVHTSAGKAAYCVGGLCGYNEGAIDLCSSTGNVGMGSHSSTMGRFCGHNAGSGGSIRRSYATGQVSADGTAVYGFNAVLISGASVSNSFFDSDTTWQSTSEGGTDKTTGEMQAESTFTTAGWDFYGETANGTDETWIKDGYPRFARSVETLTVTLHPGTGGSIAEANNGADYVGMFATGAASPTITVVADAAHAFDEWNTPLPGTVTSNVEATAQYTVNTYTLTFHSGARGAIDGERVGTASKTARDIADNQRLLMIFLPEMKPHRT